MTAIVERPIRILLVDDHEVMRSGLRMLIDSHAHMQVIGEATSRETALLLVQRVHPDVILLDLDLGADSGLDLLPELRQTVPGARIIILTGMRDLSLHKQAVQLGAVGLVMKDHSPNILLQALNHVYAGQAWLDPALVASVVTELSQATTPSQVDPEALKMKMLTERERMVIALICEGLQNKVIAQRLAISETTVRHHLTSVFAKLDLESRLELVIYAYRHGLTEIESRMQVR